MAPEVLKEELYSEKSDVYAFTIIVYEIFSYETPLKGLTINGIINKVVNQGDRPPISNDIPDVYKNLIEDCWNQNPDDRPSFDEEMKTNQFITDLTDENDFLDYIDFIENSRCSFDIKNQMLMGEINQLKRLK